jgi:hypothetical protein
VGAEPEAALMSDVSDLFLQKSRALLTTDYLPKIERSLVPLTDEDVWGRPNPVSNSIGNLMLHLAGNVTQWILGGVAGRPYARTRQELTSARHFRSPTFWRASHQWSSTLTA